MKRNLLLIVICILLVPGCNFNQSDDQSSVELALLQKQLELQEKELELKEMELKLLKENMASKPASLNDIYEHVKKAVYLIRTQKESGTSQGSAFVIAPNGIAISNYHVFKNASKIIAIHESGEEYLVTEVLHYNSEDDWVIFKIGPNNGDLAYVDLAEDLPEIGDHCFTVGNPKGLLQSLSDGLVSAYREDHRLIQTTTKITNGSSGGPLFNHAGHVVGITSSGYKQSQLNFAINIKSLPTSQYLKQDGSIGLKISTYDLLKLLNGYYLHLARKDFNKLAHSYNYTLGRYHTLFNINRQDAIEDHQNYLNNYDVIKADILEHTLDIQYNGDSYFITYDLDWRIKRKSDNKLLSYVLETVVEVNPNGCINSIYDNILKKKDSL